MSGYLHGREISHSALKLEGVHEEKPPLPPDIRDVYFKEWAHSSTLNLMISWLLSSENNGIKVSS